MYEMSPLTQLIKNYKWRFFWFTVMVLIAILFLTIGFWKTMLIVALGLVGIGIGFIKDRTEDFMIFLDKIR
ncbi:MAG TPA: DUF2273 domain-containing protein [Savagea sp.]